MIIDRARTRLLFDTDKVLTMSPLYDKLMTNKIISASSLKNGTFHGTVIEALESIEESFAVCYLKYHVSKTVAYRSDSSTVSVHWPQDPEIKTDANPLFDTTEYIVYVCSCIGIWFGLSAYSIFETMIGSWKNSAAMNATVVDRRDFTMKRKFEWQSKAISRLNREVMTIRKVFNRQNIFI